MAINNHLLIITLNVNGLNAPIKRHRVAEWIKRQKPSICCLQETHLRTKENLLGQSKQRPSVETRKRCFPEQTRIGAELGFWRRVSLSRMKRPEASFVPFLRWALRGSLPRWQ